MKKFIPLAIVPFSGFALAQSPDWITPLLEAFPILSLVFGAAGVLLGARIVMPMTEWIKVRLEKQMLEVPHPLIHAINFGLSLTLAFAFMRSGQFADDPVFGVLTWPWNVLLFALAVFLSAGGWWDREERTAQLQRGIIK